MITEDAVVLGGHCAGVLEASDAAFGVEPQHRHRIATDKMSLLANSPDGLRTENNRMGRADWFGAINSPASAKQRRRARQPDVAHEMYRPDLSLEVGASMTPLARHEAIRNEPFATQRHALTPAERVQQLEAAAQLFEQAAHENRRFAEGQKDDEAPEALQLVTAKVAYDAEVFETRSKLLRAGLLYNKAKGMDSAGKADDAAKLREQAKAMVDGAKLRRREIDAAFDKTFAELDGKRNLIKEYFQFEELKGGLDEVYTDEIQRQQMARGITQFGRSLLFEGAKTEGVMDATTLGLWRWSPGGVAFQAGMGALQGWVDNALSRERKEDRSQHP